MKFQVLQKHLLKSPVILAVKDEESLLKALKSECKIIFMLFGNICNIEEYTRLAKQHGKYIFVHLDLVDGITNREIAIDFIHQYTKADGVISTRARLLKYAKKFGLITVLRIFMLDSMALENGYQNIDYSNPDMIEILPGIATKAFALIKEYSDIPIIAGGLIRTKQDILQALTDGATAISSTRFELNEVNDIIQEFIANQAEQ
ncbi:MAG: glycerol-3-phosphate responsive antiterminator [Clostridiaceae bacterium]|nr:glycerol-3-phosphate responsive antiterminator [Clostridiaceae bacterium]